MRKFSGELETQLCGMGDAKGQIVHGVQQFALSVDTKLVQNDQRNNTQEGTTKGLFTAMQNSGGDI